MSEKECEDRRRMEWEAEYGHVTKHVLHYANARFRQLTLFLALTAGLVTLMLGRGTGLGNEVGVALAVVGFVSALSFGIMERSSNCYWKHFRDRAVVLEEHLKYELFSKKKREPWWKRATGAAACVYGLAMILWILLLLCFVFFPCVLSAVTVVWI